MDIKLDFWLFLIGIGVGVFAFFMVWISERRQLQKTRSVFKRSRVVLKPLLSKVYLLSVALALLLLGSSLGSPRFMTMREEPLKKEVGVVAVVDVSRSMRSEKEKFGPEGRLSGAKEALRYLTGQLADHEYRTAGIAFAGKVKGGELGLDENINSLALFINSLSTSLFSDQGTNFALAIKNCADTFDEFAVYRYCLLLSDGEPDDKTDFENIYQAIQYASEKNVVFYTVRAGEEAAPLASVIGSIEITFDERGESKSNLSTPSDDILLEIAGNPVRHFRLETVSKLKSDLEYMLSKIQAEATRKVEQWYSLWFYLVFSSLMLFILARIIKTRWS